jgi:hypothetical protein
MKASISIKKFLGRWVTIVLKTGLKLTVRVKSVILEWVSYEVAGSHELRSIAQSDISEIYA